MLSLSPSSVPSFILCHMYTTCTPHISRTYFKHHTPHTSSHTLLKPHTSAGISQSSFHDASDSLWLHCGECGCTSMWGTVREREESVGVRMSGRGRIESVAECGCKDVREGGVCCSEDVRVTEVSVCEGGCMLERGKRVWGVRMCGRGKSVGRWRSKEGNTKLADLECEVVRVWGGRGSRGKGERGCYLIGFSVKSISSVPAATWSRELTRMDFFHRAERIKDLEDNNHFWLILVTAWYSLVPRLSLKRGKRVCCS